MEVDIDAKIAKLEKDIEELTISSVNWLSTCEHIINVILKCLEDVKEAVLKKGFRSINDEIHFFKYQKPGIVAKLIYYNAIYKSYVQVLIKWSMVSGFWRIGKRTVCS